VSKTPRAVRFHAYGGPEVLRLAPHDPGAPGPGEVRIGVGAFGLNRVEALYRAGHFLPAAFPSRIGYEAAGVIEAVGEGVSEWRAGDRVATLYGLDMGKWGTHAEAILYPADMLVPVPASRSLTEAAASWMQYGTAFALIEIGRIAPGDAVVITAASSSVGIAAIQIARERGARPIAVTRTRQKAAALAALGADVVVSDGEDVVARIHALTGTGARLAFDAVGGAPLSALLAALAPGGIAIIYGMLAGHLAPLELPPLMMGNLTLRGWSADALLRDPAGRARMIDYVSSRLASGALKPVVDSTFPIEHIAEAHRRLESNAQLGKIIVTTSSAGA
jgi:NADPH:quinone reductase-like Zn-dependent oxidoreductase